MNDINDMLKNLSKADLQSGMKKAKEYMATEDGKKLMAELQSGKVSSETQAVIDAVKSDPALLAKLKSLFGGK